MRNPTSLDLGILGLRLHRKDLPFCRTRDWDARPRAAKLREVRRLRGMGLDWEGRVEPGAALPLRRQPWSGPDLLGLILWGMP